MRITANVVIALAATALGACGVAVGEGGNALTMVDAETMSEQTLYMAFDVSDVPLAESQLADLGIETADAIPVRVEIFETVAVAWFAPDGEPRIGQHNIVALWQVQGRQPIANQTHADEAPEVVQPNGVIANEQATLTSEPSPGEIVAEGDFTNPAEARLIDFYDRVGTPEMWLLLQELRDAHPGCI